MRDVAVAALLVLGVGAQIVACAGVALARGALNRLHYTGPSVLAAVAVAAAVLVREGFSLVADKAMILAGIVLVSSPVIVQAIARACRVNARGTIDATGADVERAA